MGRTIAALYRRRATPKHIHMARHGFGKASIATSNTRFPTSLAACDTAL